MTNRFGHDHGDVPGMVLKESWRLTIMRRQGR